MRSCCVFLLPLFVNWRLFFLCLRLRFSCILVTNSTQIFHLNSTENSGFCADYKISPKRVGSSQYYQSSVLFGLTKKFNIHSSKIFDMLSNCLLFFLPYTCQKNILMLTWQTYLILQIWINLRNIFSLQKHKELTPISYDGAEQLLCKIYCTLCFN